MSDVDLSRLRRAVADAEKAQRVRDKLVGDMRAKGATWTELGYALGITAQGAQKKYGTGTERAEAYREAQAASALRKLRKKAAAKKAPGVSH